MRFLVLGRRGGFFSELISWMIRVVIYDICITTISEVLGVPRFVALLIFLGILAAISIGGYYLRQRNASGFED
ncbi:MAG: hypothetical protein ACK6D0_15080 [Planctomyces sp.]|jgi:hypothetical protein